MKPQNTKFIVRVACLAVAVLMAVGMVASVVMSLL